MKEYENNDFVDLFSALNSVVVDSSINFIKLIRYTSTPIESEEEVLERAEVMDELMDIVKHESDITLVFINAIADRIKEFEDNMEMPFLSVIKK